MDYETLKGRLTDRLGLTPEEIESLMQGLTQALTACGADLDSVAIPTFGTFRPVKHKEEVRADLSTGRQMLFPPEITLEFTPGAMLLKRLRHE